MTDIASLTREEAAERAALIDVERYDVHVDLRGLFEGGLWAATSTISFSCREPGASTFVDCVGDVSSATLNGEALDPATAERGRIPLPDLRADNVLVGLAHPARHRLRHRDPAHGRPSDKLVYVWTTFEPDEARCAWACFDQPDLKAPHGFVRRRPRDLDGHQQLRRPTWSRTVDDGGRRWTFARHAAAVDVRHGRQRRAVPRDPVARAAATTWACSAGSRSRTFLERDAEELFDLTDRGLAFFGERFGQPFPQERYDQVFVPEHGRRDGELGLRHLDRQRALPQRPRRTASARVRAQVLLHEMAHMWFGDLVTMRWWDDLWLNEAFAVVGLQLGRRRTATEFTDEWATFLAGGKMAGYRADMAPATHPIRGDVPRRRRRRWRTSTRSPTPRAPACSSS